MTCRGVRGAITVEANTRSAILDATRHLLTAMTAANAIVMDQVASVIFTATADLDAAYPAVAARELGWTDIPLLCMQEMVVADSLRRCVRVLMHWNTSLAASEIQHIYLRGAKVLRPDLVEGEG